MPETTPHLSKHKVNNRPVEHKASMTLQALCPDRRAVRRTAASQSSPDVGSVYQQRRRLLPVGQTLLSSGPTLSITPPPAVPSLSEMSPSAPLGGRRVGVRGRGPKEAGRQRCL